MNVSLNWLKEFVDIDLGVEELAHQLTMLGLEIEQIDRPGAEIRNVYIGKILEIKPHPDADKLVVCQTDTGGANPLQIVCGAKNMKVGDLVPTAVLGATLPGGFEIGKRKMRGIESQGMMCSSRELGLGKDHDGLMILPTDLPIGADAIPLLGLDDVIYEIEVTPNRGDWAGMIGVARELAAFFKRPLRLPDATVVESGDAVADLTSILIEAPELCARYIGRVISGLKPAKTPLWMAQRLIHAGQRLVDPAADITNYILLETGHPLHAFDYDTLAEHRIVVRRARAGESIKTIDGETRSLRDDMLVIADAQRPVAIAGIMGGQESEVGENTTRILLESAWFNPSSIRKTARALAMNTEASQRFQRGADIDMTTYAANRAAQLLHTVCGGQVASGIVDVHPVKTAPIEIALRFDRTARLLGATIPAEEQCSILERLEFKIANRDAAGCKAIVPTWRHDATREADLIEEIARLHGYDNIPATVPQVRKSDEVFAPEEVATRHLRRHLVAIGLTELMSLTFSSPAEMKQAGLGGQAESMVMLANPLSETSSAMRASLIPNLLNVASLNCRRGTRRIKAFEIGHVYLPSDNELPHEESRLGIVMSGLRDAPHWGSAKSPIDIFDIKGLLENIFNFTGADVTWSAGDYPSLQPGYAGVVTLGKAVIARYGKVRPGILEANDIDQDVFVAEVNLSPILRCKSELAVFQAMSAFPPSLRDMALIVDTSISAEAILESARKSGGKLLQNVEVFDVYIGKSIPAGKKSIALSLTFQSPERTLTDKDTQKAWDQILKTLEQSCGAALRS